MNQVVTIIAFGYILTLANFLTVRECKSALPESGVRRAYRRMLGMLRGFASGLMTVLICFQTLPSSLQGTFLYIGIGAIIIGVVFSVFIENLSGCSGYGAMILFPLSLVLFVLLDQQILSRFMPPVRINLCRCFIGGILLHIACGEMTPDSHDPWHYGMTTLGSFIGFAVGILKNF